MSDVEPDPKQRIHPDNLRPGQADPWMSRTVREIIEIEVDAWVVFTDDKLETYWWFDANEQKEPAGFGEVSGRVARLEAIQIAHLEEATRVAFRTLVAQGMARLFSDENVENARVVHEHAERFIAARLAEKSRQWYLTSGLVGAAATVVVGILWGMVNCEDPVTESWCVDAPIWLGRCMAAGGLGAAFWLIARMGSFPLDPDAGLRLHVLEAAARLVVGTVAGGLAYLASDAGVILGHLGSDHASALLLVAFAAGATERFVPNLVQRVNARAMPPETAAGAPAAAEAARAAPPGNPPEKR